ncbi:MAG: DUF202 domain-containing protein [Actinomycetota bacterium]|nr:DUF202 domain-containing protein [Actinomycetota bacterium]
MTQSVARKSPDDGLQAERTALSWSRTSLGVLGNGALLLLRDLHDYTGPLRLVPAGLALVVALLTYLVGVRRQRLLMRRPLPQRIAPRREVQVIGASMLILITVTAVLLPV